MQNIVIKEVRKIIDNQPNGLKGEEWEDNYFAPTNGKSVHVSEVDYVELSKQDLLRFLSYLLLESNDASERRIRNNG